MRFIATLDMETVESPGPVTYHPAPQAMICSRNRSRNLFISCARCAGSCPCTAKCARSPLPRLPFDLCGVVLHPLFCSRLAGFRKLFRWRSVSLVQVRLVLFSLQVLLPLVFLRSPKPAPTDHPRSLAARTVLKKSCCSACQECRHCPRGRCRSLGCCPEPL